MQNNSSKNVKFAQGTLHDNIFFQKIAGENDSKKSKFNKKNLNNTQEGFLKSFNDDINPKQNKLKINADSAHVKNLKKNIFEASRNKQVRQENEKQDRSMNNISMQNNMGNNHKKSKTKSSRNNSK